MKAKSITANILILAATALFFNACSTKEFNTYNDCKVERYYHKGFVESQSKVIVDKSLVSVVKSAAIGGAVGGTSAQIIKKDKKTTLEAAVIGSVIGGVAGLFSSNDVVAYETKIQAKNGKTFQVYLNKKLPLKAQLEFTIDGNKLKNIAYTEDAKREDLYR